MDGKGNGNNMIVLASGSPRRIEMLRNIGVSFDIRASGGDESHPMDCGPARLVCLLSKRKAEGGYLFDDDIVIGADTVVFHNGNVLEKPADREHAKRMLTALSGSCHEVYTGFTVKSREKTVVDYCVTKVYFKDLSDEEIEDYLNTEEYKDKAGGYGIQQLGGIFVDKIDGDYNNVVGLPLSRVMRVLRDEFGYDIIKNNGRT